MSFARLYDSQEDSGLVDGGEVFAVGGNRCTENRDFDGIGRELLVFKFGRQRRTLRIPDY